MSHKFAGDFDTLVSVLFLYHLSCGRAFEVSEVNKLPGNFSLSDLVGSRCLPSIRHHYEIMTSSAELLTVKVGSHSRYVR